MYMSSHPVGHVHPHWCQVTFFLSNIPDSSTTTDGSSIIRLLRIIRGYNYSDSHDVSSTYTFSAGDHIRPRNFFCDTNTDFFYRRRCTFMQCAQQHTLVFHS